MNARIDHFMYAFPSLESGTAWAEETFGVAPAYGGEHVGLGTRNALLSLDSAYLEIIVPDPAQDLTDTFGGRLTELSAGGLVTWAVEADLRAIAATLAERGVQTVGPDRTRRQNAAGDLLEWELLFPVGSPHGGRMPFFIDWLACINPRQTAPSGGTLDSVVVTTPDADDLRSTLQSTGLDVAVIAGEPGLNVNITAPAGEVILRDTGETRRLSFGKI